MILIDAHVHIHNCFDLETFLDSAFANFKAQATRCGQQDAFMAILLLAETSKDNWFRRLADFTDGEGVDATGFVDKWSFEDTRENCSLFVRSEKSQGLFLIAGRQVVTAEGLEVLALLTAENFKDGSLIEELIEEIRTNGGIPVIPWGFGKWMGNRGRIVSNILRRETDSLLFLGDNSGRPAFLADPPHFKVAERKGIRVLPGTDPLPFPSESHRAGSFGCAIEGTKTITSESPSRDLKCLLLDQGTCCRAYGNLEQTYRFFRNQLMLRIVRQLYKRKYNQYTH